LYAKAGSGGWTCASSYFFTPEQQVIHTGLPKFQVQI
jgi:hypothetical protein